MAWFEEKIVEFDHEVYKNLCDEMRDILRYEKELADRKAKTRELLIKEAGGDRVEYGIKVEYRTAKGSIDYKKAVESLAIKEDYLEKFRGSPRNAWYVVAY